MPPASRRHNSLHFRSPLKHDGELSRMTYQLELDRTSRQGAETSGYRRRAREHQETPCSKPAAYDYVEISTTDTGTSDYMGASTEPDKYPAAALG